MTSGIPCQECSEYPAVIQTPWDARYLCTVCLVDTEV